MEKKEITNAKKEAGRFTKMVFRFLLIYFLGAARINAMMVQAVDAIKAVVMISF